jgi:hypothetical protein
MWRVFVRSRSGNVVLGVIGAVYTLLAVSVLWRYIAEVGDAAGTLDRIFQAALIGSAICGIWFVRNALANLGIRPRRHYHHRPQNAPR